MDDVDDLKWAMRIHIESDKRIASHLPMLDERSPEAAYRLTQHILGSVHLFPPSRDGSVFYAKLYHEIERMTLQVLYELITETGGLAKSPGEYDRIPGL